MKIFRKWISDKKTISDLVKEYDKSISTVRRIIDKFINQPPPLQIKLNDNCHLIIDATYFKSDFCLAEYFDNNLKRLQHQSIMLRENFTAFVKDLEYLRDQGLKVLSITSDGHKSLIKAVKQVFPGVIHQRCIVHVQRMSLIYLTRFPKTEAGRDLRELVLWLHEIKSHTAKDLWIIHFQEWCEYYDSYLKEQSTNPLTGRKWYTHKFLRRTRTLIKNALPSLFHYLDNPDIPKSTNGLESRFSYLKNELKIHRGLSNKDRQNFALWRNYFKYNKD